VFVIYTAVFGGYDTLKEPTPLPGVEYLCFTDQPQRAGVWKYVVQEPGTNTPRLAARMRKILSHRYLPPGTTYSMWVDANVLFLGNIETTVTNFLSEADIALFGHPTRQCIYAEAHACTVQGKGDPECIAAQAARYRNEGYPEGNGLYETTMLLRRHTDAITELNRHWWGEVVAHSMRDQISFPYVLWLYGITPALFPGEVSKSPAVDYSSTHQPYEEES
jgi:hypothetical protein